MFANIVFLTKGYNMRALYFLFAAFIIATSSLSMERAHQSSASSSSSRGFVDVTHRVNAHAFQQAIASAQQRKQLVEGDLRGGAISPDGQKIEIDTDYYRSDLYAYDAKGAGYHASTLNGISAIAVNHDGSVQAIGSSTGDVTIKGQEVSERTHTIRARVPIRSIALDKDGNWVAFSYLSGEKYCVTMGSMEPQGFQEKMSTDLPKASFTECIVALNETASRLVVLRTMLQRAAGHSDNSFHVYEAQNTQTGAPQSVSLSPLYTFKMECRGMLASLPSWSERDWLDHAPIINDGSLAKRSFIPFAVALSRNQIHVGYKGFEVPYKLKQAIPICTAGTVSIPVDAVDPTYPNCEWLGLLKE